jgi:hypothetical protein
MLATNCLVWILHAVLHDEWHLVCGESGRLPAAVVILDGISVEGGSCVDGSEFVV